MPSWYQTNFQRGDHGNMLRYGKKNLIVRIPGARWVAGRLSQKRQNGSYKVIQIEQTGTRNNPWKDTIVFEMLKVDGGQIVPMSLGGYRITVRAMKRSVVGVRDEFYVG